MNNENLLLMIMSVVCTLISVVLFGYLAITNGILYTAIYFGVLGVACASMCEDKENG